MGISQVYQQYKIMPSLQFHMYRVAGVAYMICDGIPQSTVDRTSIISACLLHDMGNIIKFKLDAFPEFLQPEGFDYWNGVKEEYKHKYGSDEHEATLAIARELKVSERTYELINAIGFSKAKQNYETSDIAKKICAYADMRVQPYGVTSLQQRLADGRKRFQIRKPEVDNQTFFDEMSEYLTQIEGQLFSTNLITSDTITEDKVQHIIPQLTHFELI